MPVIVIATVGLQILCAVHVIRTRRAVHWLYLVMLFPLAGSFAYFVVEIVPELRHGRAAKLAVKDLGAVIDADRNLRELSVNLERVDSVQNKIDLARACMDRERFAEAMRLIEDCLSGVYEDDPNLMLMLAQARFGMKDHAGACETLERLRAAHPDFRSPKGHLIYAQSVEGQGRIEEALIEYEALAAYFPGEEARCRHALLLQKTGRITESKRMFHELTTAVEKASKVYFRAQRDWYQVAKRNLNS